MQLYSPTRVYSEENCVVKHGKELAALGTKAMIVTGRRSAVTTGALADVIQALARRPMWFSTGSKRIPPSKR